MIQPTNRNATGKMSSIHKARRRFHYIKTMLQLFWNRIKTLFNKICHLKLNFFLWLCCILLVVFIIFMCRHRSEESDYQPVIVWWTDGFPGPEDTLRTCDDRSCHVMSNKSFKNEDGKVAYLFYGSQLNFDSLPPRNPSKVIWGLYHEESPRNVDLLLHERVLTLFNYSSTFSRHSDVSFVLQYLDKLEDITTTEFYVPTSRKNKLLDEISPVLYIQSDCETMTERDDYVLELMKHIKVDSYGTCLNNKDLPRKFMTDYLNNLDENEFLKFVAKYKFTIAIENAVCEDYITEKFWRTMKVGSVPLYFGSPSIADWLPNPKSAILLQDYPSPQEVAQYLKLLMKNDTLYEEHLRHKLKRVIDNKRLIKEFEGRPQASDALKTSEDFECFVCHKLHDVSNDLRPSVVDKRHYNCPKPVSALPGALNENSWLLSWSRAKDDAERVYQNVMKENT